jgi:hypothetical protein
VCRRTGLFHVIFGALVVVAFVLTGQYMDRFHEHLAGMADGQRMLYRSRHIYILLAGLLNLGLGAYWQLRPTRHQRALQLTGSALVVSSTCLLVAAFFYEPPLADPERVPLSRAGLYTILAGTLLHLLSGAGRGVAAAEALTDGVKTEHRDGR